MSKLPSSATLVNKKKINEGENSIIRDEKQKTETFYEYEYFTDHIAAAPSGPAPMCSLVPG
jgi:hypothetical protein